MSYLNIESDYRQVICNRSLGAFNLLCTMLEEGSFKHRFATVKKSAKYWANKIGVSVRSIYYYLNILEHLGVIKRKLSHWGGPNIYTIAKNLRDVFKDNTQVYNICDPMQRIADQYCKPLHTKSSLDHSLERGEEELINNQEITLQTPPPLKDVINMEEKKPIGTAFQALTPANVELFGKKFFGLDITIEKLLENQAKYHAKRMSYAYLGAENMAKVTPEQFFKWLTTEEACKYPSKAKCKGFGGGFNYEGTPPTATYETRPTRDTFNHKSIIEYEAKSSAEKERLRLLGLDKLADIKKSLAKI